MNGYGGTGIVGGGVGTLAATGAGSLLPAIAGVCLVFFGLLLVRLGAVRGGADD